MDVNKPHTEKNKKDTLENVLADTDVVFTLSCLRMSSVLPNVFSVFLSVSHCH